MPRTRKTKPIPAPDKLRELLQELARSWKACADILQDQPGQARAVATYRECAEELEMALTEDTSSK